jgi:hypothetical protein
MSQKKSGTMLVTYQTQNTALKRHAVVCFITNIQGVPGGKVNILGGHSIGHSKQKLYMNMCPILNGF